MTVATSIEPTRGEGKQAPSIDQLVSSSHIPKPNEMQSVRDIYRDVIQEAYTLAREEVLSSQEVLASCIDTSTALSSIDTLIYERAKTHARERLQEFAGIYEKIGNSDAQKEAKKFLRSAHLLIKQKMKKEGPAFLGYLPSPCADTQAYFFAGQFRGENEAENAPVTRPSTVSSYSSLLDPQQGASPETARVFCTNAPAALPYHNQRETTSSTNIGADKKQDVVPLDTLYSFQAQEYVKTSVLQGLISRMSSVQEKEEPKAEPERTKPEETPAPTYSLDNSPRSARSFLPAILFGAVAASAAIGQYASDPQETAYLQSTPQVQVPAQRYEMYNASVSVGTPEIISVAAPRCVGSSCYAKERIMFDSEGNPDSKVTTWDKIYRVRQKQDALSLTVGEELVGLDLRVGIDTTGDGRFDKIKTYSITQTQINIPVSAVPVHIGAGQKTENGFLYYASVQM